MSMGWLGWLKGKGRVREAPGLQEWRRQWRTACAEAEAGSVAHLTAALNSLSLPEEDVEIEREMLAGLEHLIALRATVAASDLPVVETGHRVVGQDVCHFSTPASMPDDPTQPSGRLILTNARAIFVGGGKTVTVPWHAVSNVIDQERDLVLVRRDREAIHRIRCNVFDDVLSAAFVARTLASRHQRPRPSAEQR
jgi:hypothetical protein